VDPRPTRRNKKSAARRSRATLLLKLAPDVPLCGGDGVRTLESEQEQTLGNYELSLIIRAQEPSAQRSLSRGQPGDPWIIQVSATH